MHIHESGHGAQCAAKEVESDDAASRVSGNDCRCGTSFEPAVYARDRLPTSRATSSEGQKDDGVMPSVGIKTSTKPHSKGATQVDYPALVEANGLGKAPQQKCVAWRSVVGSVAGVLPTDQVEPHKLERQAREVEVLK